MLILDNLKQTGKKRVLVAILMLFLIPLFPVLLLLVKFVAIFHQRKEWKKLSNMMTLCEGSVNLLIFFVEMGRIGCAIYIVKWT